MSPSVPVARVSACMTVAKAISEGRCTPMRGAHLVLSHESSRQMAIIGSYIQAVATNALGDEIQPQSITARL
jgi:hypothetical protein